MSGGAPSLYESRESSTGGGLTVREEVELLRGFWWEGDVGEVERRAGVRGEIADE